MNTVNNSYSRIHSWTFRLAPNALPLRGCIGFPVTHQHLTSRAKGYVSNEMINSRLQAWDLSASKSAQRRSRSWCINQKPSLSVMRTTTLAVRDLNALPFTNTIIIITRWQPRLNHGFVCFCALWRASVFRELRLVIISHAAEWEIGLRQTTRL